MKINKFFGVEGAKKARGITIVIDIFRAATVEAFLLSKEAKEIIPVGTVKEAFKYKKENPNYILCGEDRGYKIEGFDLDNSPFEISKIKSLEGKTIIHRSSSGTQGIVNAENSQEIIFGSFVTASAITEYLVKHKPSICSIIAMDGPDTEDEIFADFLISKLKNELPRNIDEITEYLSRHHAAARFLDPNRPEFPKEDFYLSMDVDRFNFVPLVQDKKVIKYTNHLTA
ncbi:MAG: 2-phosphosulfolactate phosphatase [Melioribacteraceae bacterium]